MNNGLREVKVVIIYISMKIILYEPEEHRKYHQQACDLYYFPAL
ncbi:hypothetical protein IMPR6_50249 [Imperialibacter sp. EC-SDR9]|nr:hypothetical protein IMPERIA75_600247 [Imperialibacter sp. 75]VVT31082.1 hypothetical protein IMPR6_50249 [Imperialibacter sp. EC-SDR9]